MIGSNYHSRIIVYKSQSKTSLECLLESRKMVGFPNQRRICGYIFELKKEFR